MALATQCPHCYTSFRVANDQLKLHAGMVRCGACKQTFNGIEHLLEPGEAPRTPPSKTSVEEAPVESTETRIDKDESELTSEKGLTVNDDASSPLPQPEPKTEALVDTEEDTPAYPSDHNLESTLGNVNEPVSQQLSDPVINQVSEQISEQLSDLGDSSPIPTNTEQAISVETQDIEISVDESESKDVPNASTLEDSEQSLNQQALDDIALFQEKLASFAPQIDFPSESVTKPEDNLDQLTTQHASSHLEIIKQDDSTTSDHDDNRQDEKEGNSPTEIIPRANPASLTSSLDFELNEDERSLTEPDNVSLLEIQTQAAIIDGDDSKYSRHEPVFSDDTVLEDELEHDLQQLLAETKQADTDLPQTLIAGNSHAEARQEPTISITDPEPTSDIQIEDDAEEPEFMINAEKAKRYSKVQMIALWFGIVLLLITASAQALYFFRSGIAAHFPQTKPLILQMCQKLNCQIKLPTQIDNIVFDSTELLTVNQDPHILSLSMQLQNKSAMAQAWPMLELTLKDSRGKTVLQRVFTPEEYLENKAMVAKGFAANSDSNIKVFFELSTMKAANYAVGVFYP